MDIEPAACLVLKYLGVGNPRWKARSGFLTRQMEAVNSEDNRRGKQIHPHAKIMGVIPAKKGKGV